MNNYYEEVLAIKTKIAKQFELIKTFDSFHNQVDKKINETKQICERGQDINYKSLKESINESTLAKALSEAFTYFENLNTGLSRDTLVVEIKSLINKHKERQYKDGAYYLGETDKNGNRLGLGGYVGANKELFYGIFEKDFYKSGIFSKNTNEFYIGEFNFDSVKDEFVINGLMISGSNIFCGKIYPKLNILDGYFWKDDYIFMGKTVNGLKECEIGYLMKYKDKFSVVKSQFKNDAMTGKVLYYLQDSTLCEIVNETVNSIYYISDNSVISSKLKEGSGNATILYENSDYYIGEIKENQKHGKGKMKINSYKTLFEGEFDEDKFMSGSILHFGIKKFIGKVEDEKLLQGKYIYDNDNYYEGKFKDNEREGEGTFHYNNLIQYLGKWSKGLKEGKGVLTINKRDIEADWISNKLIYNC
jgi:hypothetical protein